MWNSFRNFLHHATTYRDLSPDLGVRRIVDRQLLKRPKLTREQWFTCYCASIGIHPDVADFCYQYLHQYSGLPSGRIQWNDRLEADLHWTEICWFDWEMTLCDDFLETFGIDISDRLIDFYPQTIGDLVTFLSLEFSHQSAVN